VSSRATNGQACGVHIVATSASVLAISPPDPCPAAACNAPNLLDGVLKHTSASAYTRALAWPGQFEALNRAIKQQLHGAGTAGLRGGKCLTCFVGTIGVSFIVRSLHLYTF